MMLALKNKGGTGHYMVTSESTPTGISYRVRFPAFMHNSKTKKSAIFHSSNGGAEAALKSAVAHRDATINAYLRNNLGDEFNG